MHRPDIVPYLSYRDGAAAIDFLTDGLGFEVVIRQDAEDGTVTHAELRRGNGMILMGTADLPTGTPGLYLVTDDVDAARERAMAAGATEVYPPEDTEWGTRRWRMRDPEGQEWTFGTYRPQSEPPDWG